jgi:hypothetical protein
MLSSLTRPPPHDARAGIDLQLSFMKRGPRTLVKIL